MSHKHHPGLLHHSHFAKDWHSWLKLHKGTRRIILLCISIAIIFAVGAFVHGEWARAIDKALDGVMVGFAEATFENVG